MDAWSEAGRRVLALELRSLKQLCRERFGGALDAELGAGETSVSLDAERERVAAAMERPPPLDFLREAFALDAFESRVFVLACAAQLEPEFLRLFAALGAEKSRLPTPALALELFAPQRSPRSCRRARCAGTA